jgi:hypothetical protein
MDPNMSVQSTSILKNIFHPTFLMVFSLPSLNSYACEEGIALNSDLAERIRLKNSGEYKTDDDQKYPDCAHAPESDTQIPDHVIKIFHENNKSEKATYPNSNKTICSALLI